MSGHIRCLRPSQINIKVTNKGYEEEEFHYNGLQGQSRSSSRCSSAAGQHPGSSSRISGANDSPDEGQGSSRSRSATPTASNLFSRLNSSSSKKSSAAAPEVFSFTPNPAHNHEILMMMAKVLRKFEEVANKHAERLRFLDPELESTNTRIEVLESVIQANDDRVMDVIRNLDVGKLKEIIKIKESISKSVLQSSKILQSKTIIRSGSSPGSKVGGQDDQEDPDDKILDESAVVAPVVQDEGFFQIDHVATKDCKESEFGFLQISTGNSPSIQKEKQRKLLGYPGG